MSALRNALAPAALLVATPAAARQDTQLWLSANAGGRIAGPVDASLDVVQRHGDHTDGLYQRVIVGMLGYHLSKRIQLWAGYADSRNYSDGHRTVLEHRLRQDVRAVVARPWGGALMFRLRTEQRWRDGAHGTGWRARFQGRFTKPVLGPTALFVSHESFVNLDSTSWGQQAGWERMRNAIGLQIPLSKAIRTEVGYLNQYLRQPGSNEDAHAATLSLGVTW